jgi:phage shock protein C
MQVPTQRLMRSRQDKLIGGVAGGISRFLAIDPFIPRLIFVVLTLSSGIGTITYLVLWVIMPIEPVLPNTSATPPITGQLSPDTQKDRTSKLGTVLVILGASLLISKMLPWIYPYVIPALLIGAGVILFYRSR